MTLLSRNQGNQGNQGESVHVRESHETNLVLVMQLHFREEERSSGVW